MRFETTQITRRVAQVLLVGIGLLISLCLPALHAGPSQLGASSMAGSVAPTMPPSIAELDAIRMNHSASTQGAVSAPETPPRVRQQLSSRGGKVDVLPLEDIPWTSFRATWYSALDGGGQGTITATGSHVQDGWTVAVDPHVIPLGSLLQVRFADGTTHTFQALDTGGAIVGNHIDIFDSSRVECLTNGVQPVKVRILGKGKR